MNEVPFWTQAREIARKDLMVEGRAGEVLLLTIPFGAVALLVVPLAVGINSPLLASIGTGMFWVVTLLFGMFVAFRHTAVDGPAQSEMLRLVGIDPAARFTGRVAAGSLLFLLLEMVLAPVTVVLYNPEIGDRWLLAVPVMVLVAVGLALIGTLAAAVTAGLHTRNSLAPLLVAPLAVPLLLGASQAMDALRSGRSILSWALILVVTDLTLAVVGVVTARPLEDSVR